MLTMSWNRFYQQFKADLKLWCYFVLFQQACRLCFLYTLSNYLEQNIKLSDIALAMLYGLRFDSLWATIWILIALLLFTLPSTFSNAKRPANLSINTYRRQYLGGVFTIITTIIYIISIEYYRAFKDVFNQFLFALFKDDQVAILKTIVTEHNVGLHFTVLSIISIILILYIIGSRYIISTKNSALRALLTNSVHEYSACKKVIISFLILTFYIIGLHTSMISPTSKLNNTSFITDPFLNKAIISPYSSLYYAINEFLAIHNEKGYRYIARTKHDLTELAKRFFHDQSEYPTLTEYMKKTAPGSTLPKPRHIFLIIGESLDAWPLQKKYRKFNLTSNLQKLIRHGVYLKYFLPCANGTMPALNTIITGLHDVELLMNYQKNSVTPYRTALALQFKNLGFKTQLFYGGYLSWQHLQDFAYAQGFDAVYGINDIDNWKQTNQWGGDDRTLFDFITKTIKTTKRPTFNIIMTTSNHPPFSIDLKQEGFDEETTAKLLAQYQNTEMRVKELGHIWYADKAIGEFVEKITKIDNDALFAITGDHFGLRHILPTPPFFDVSAVPLILYARNIKDHYKFQSHAAGSHMDIGPTMIELVASKGFHYYAMGKPLFATKNNTFGIGQKKIITADFVASTISPEITYFKQHTKPVTTEQLNALIARHEQAMSIAWWLIKRSDELK